MEVIDTGFKLILFAPRTYRSSYNGLKTHFSTKIGAGASSRDRDFQEENRDSPLE